MSDTRTIREVTIGDCRLICGDCLDVLPTLEAGSVDAVVTDPPYPKEYTHVWQALGSPCFRVVREKGFLSTLLGHYQVPHVLETILAGGWKWWWMCTARNNNQQIMHGFKAKCCHKPAMVFRKGQALPRRIFYDDYSLRVKTSEWAESQMSHKWGQASGLFIEPVDAFAPFDGVILDPFMGGASCGVVAMRLGRKFIGIENNEHCFDIACNRIEEAYADTALFDGQPEKKERQSELF